MSTPQSDQPGKNPPATARTFADDLQGAPDAKESADTIDISPEAAARIASLDPEQSGEHIGNFKLLQQIGHGGFGSVWMAEQERPIRRRVALKIVKLGMDTKQVIARFEQERQALALMDHPNIAKILDAGATDRGRPYFVMELVRGVSITAYCDKNNVRTEERLRLFTCVCGAVQHAHQKGIIHRDLKPSNILVTMHDGVAVPKVIDFGIAKATQQQRLTDLTLFTEYEQMVGTPLYMSPEQAEMSGLDIDTRSDIYSLGVLLYELLTDRTPFDPATLMKRGVDEIRRVIREDEPKKPSTMLATLGQEVITTVARHQQSEGPKLVRSLRGDLDWIVMKAIEKDRTRRYESASGLAADVQRHLAGEPIVARPTGQIYRLRRFVRRNRLAVAAAASLILVLAIGLSASLISLAKERAARRLAASALAQLRDTAPTFHKQAKILLEQGKFEEALATNKSAIELEPASPDYHHFQANLLQASERLRDAKREYEAVLQAAPDHAEALANLRLCDELLAENGRDAPLSEKVQRRLLKGLLAQERMIEAARLNAKFQADAEALLAALLPRLAEYSSQAGWSSKRVRQRSDGTFGLDLSNLKLGDLGALAQFPITELTLNESGLADATPLRAFRLTFLSLRKTWVTDLQPLAGMPLRFLDLWGTGISSLEPLRGMQLDHLEIGNTRVADLSPLEGMPLHSLYIEWTKISDLGPLRGAPLERLYCKQTNVSDLSPLRGAPMRKISLPRSVTTIEALSGAPLEHFSFSECDKLTSLKPVLQAPLESVHLPPMHPDTILLKDIPTLVKFEIRESKRNSDKSAGPFTREQFWKAYGPVFQLLAESAPRRAAVVDIVRKNNWVSDPEKAVDYDESGGLQVNVHDTGVDDLSPLAGMPVRSLHLSGCWRVDLTPLRDIPSLRRLDLVNSRNVDLTPLRGLKLETLSAGGADLTDLSPLRGMPLKRAHFDRCPPLDVSPLSECLELETLTIPKEALNVDALRKLPKLQYLDDHWTGNLDLPARPVAEFWAKRDRKDK